MKCSSLTDRPVANKTTIKNCWIAQERDMLLEMTKMLDEHPEGYDGPCLCKMCMSYSD